jgi:predicted dehydrogenase
MRIGLIGAGSISATHARAARAISGVEVVAVYGANLEKVSHLGQQYGAAGYQDFEAFLAHRPMEMVIVGSPSGLHAQQGILAARQALHVLVEKPIATSVEQSAALIGACEKAGVKLGVIFQDRFKPQARLLKQLIEEGSLGRILLAEARVKWYRDPEYYSKSRWRGTWELDGGGALMNQGVHTVDLLLWLLGDVTRVHAWTASLRHSIATEDTALALLEFRSGTLATLLATTAAYPGYPRRIEITGTEGTVVFENDVIVAADLRDRAQGLSGPAGVDMPGSLAKPGGLGKNDAPDRNPSASSPMVSDTRGHQSAIEDFIHAVEQDEKPACDGHEAQRSVALIEKIYQTSAGAVVAKSGKL